MDSFDPKSLQKEFPWFAAHKGSVYLDSAATALTPQCVIDAITTFYQEQYATIHRSVYPQATALTEEYEKVRAKTQQFLGAASASEIVFTKGTTESLNLVASSYGRAFLQKGDAVLITQTEHHANIVPWQLICKEREAQLLICPVDAEGYVIEAEYRKRLRENVKIVSMAHVSNVTGSIQPIQRLCALAQEVGAIFVVDGAQSTPHIPINVQELGVDFYACSSHKAYGPMGVGILYGKRGHLENMPPYQSGGDMVDVVHFEQTTFQKPPLKFEAGTPMIGGILGWGAALEFLQRIRQQGCLAYEAALNQYAAQQLATLKGMTRWGDPQGQTAIHAFTLQGVHPMDIGTLLGAQNICVRTGNLCAQPGLHFYQQEYVIRLSTAAYTTKEDIDRCTTALSSLVEEYSLL